MKDVIASWIGTAVTGVTCVLSEVSVYQYEQIILGAISILAGLVTLGFTVWKWYRAAKADGKITKEEIEDLIDQASDKIEEIKEKKDDQD